MISDSQIKAWQSEIEGENLEFKEARSGYDNEKLMKYCCALANEGGGFFVLGMTDKRPRKVVGSSAFLNVEKVLAQVLRCLNHNVAVYEHMYDGKRLVVFRIDSRPVGQGIQYNGAYWKRRGEELIPMQPNELSRIFGEGRPDFSSEICSGAQIDDLDRDAIETFRKRWAAKTNRPGLLTTTREQLLEDAELTVDGKVTNAALLLLGTAKSLGRFIPAAELIYEYRMDQSSIAHQSRQNFREGFLIIQNEIWKLFSLRNTIHSISDGLFRREIQAFNEDATREAILNAFCHRDYRLPGSVFIKQYQVLAQIISPGGFPPEINLENILFRQSPRNRRLSEACEKCGLVERSGQGIDRMFSASVSEGKLPPDFSGTDSSHVELSLHGQVKDPMFLKFLEKISSDTTYVIETYDLVVLDAINREVPIPTVVKPRTKILLEHGVLEQVARKKLILSRKFYSFVGKPGQYTRKRGLEKKTEIALLLDHLRSAGFKGCPLKEFLDLLPNLTKSQVQVLLRGLRKAGRIKVVGTKRAARWLIT